MGNALLCFCLACQQIQSQTSLPAYHWKEAFEDLASLYHLSFETMAGKSAKMWLISEEASKTKLFLQGLFKVKYGWIVFFSVVCIFSTFSLMNFAVGICVLWFALVFWGLHWYFEVCIGILRFALVFWDLHWYFEVGWLRADMVGLCLFPLTINCRPTAMQCSHRQKRGSIVFCNFVFLYFCFSSILFLSGECKNEYAKSIKPLYF